VPPTKAPVFVPTAKPVKTQAPTQLPTHKPSTPPPTPPGVRFYAAGRVDGNMGGIAGAQGICEITLPANLQCPLGLAPFLGSCGAPGSLSSCSNPEQSIGFLPPQSPLYSVPLLGANSHYLIVDTWQTLKNLNQKRLTRSFVQANVVPSMINGKKIVADIWTGSNWAAGVSSHDCKGWTSASASDMASVGDGTAKNYHALVSSKAGGTASCAQSKWLVCACF
jgi:hypothetical protein